MEQTHISQRLPITTEDFHLLRLWYWSLDLALWVQRPYPTAVVYDDFKPCSRTEDAMAYLAAAHDPLIRPIERHLRDTRKAFEDLVSKPSTEAWRRLRYAMDNLQGRIVRAVDVISGSQCPVDGTPIGNEWKLRRDSLGETVEDQMAVLYKKDQRTADLDSPEIAVILGCSPGAVRKTNAVWKMLQEEKGRRQALLTKKSKPSGPPKKHASDDDE